MNIGQRYQYGLVVGPFMDVENLVQPPLGYLARQAGKENLVQDALTTKKSSA